MRRRDFITLLGGAGVGWPLTARAQQAGLPVIGFLHSGSPQPYAPQVNAFRQGLREAGYVEGKNVAIEYRWAENQYDRLPALAADLVRRQVAVIFANNPAALPAKAATTTIPIVFTVGLDPIAVGLVASLNRPGGNLTGIASQNVAIGPKPLELLHEVVPRATVIALLVNPTNPNAQTLSRDVQAAARALGLEPHVLHASAERDFETAMAAVAQARAGGLVIAPDSFFSYGSEQLAALTLRHAVPTITPYRQFAAAGGLMSYGSNLTDNIRLAGVYTGRILKGEKPADLPVQQSSKIELIINLKTAKALGLTFPLALLTRADEVIE
jgi:putative ABC transport system substrate-binding protein